MTLNPKTRRRALVVVAGAFVLDLVDMTVVNVAVPSIQRDFGAGGAAAQWWVAAYSIAFSILLVAGGRLGDRYGYRSLFLFGITAFTIASTVCGLAVDAEMLVFARFAQGAAAAMMLPQVLSIVQTLYAPHERIGVLALFGALGGISAVGGPILGGLIIQANIFGLGWRPIFLINIPVGIAAILAGRALLPNAKAPGEAEIDLIGTALLALLLVAIIVPLIEGPPLGWPAWTFASLLAAMTFLWLLIGHDRRRASNGGSPLIAPGLFQVRPFSIALVMSIGFPMAVGGFLFALTLTLQNGLGYKPLATGLVHIPFAAGVSFSIAILSRRLLPKLGPRMVSGGAVLMLFGLAALFVLFADPAGLVVRPLLLVAPLLVLGLGMGMIAGPLQPIALSEIESHQIGSASGVLKTVEQFGVAAGIAAVGGVYLALGGQAGSGQGAISAFRAALVMIGALLLSPGLLALAIPRELRIFATQVSS